MHHESVSVEILYQGRPVETTMQAAQRRGLGVNTLRPALSRAGLEPVAYLDGRTPLYEPDAVDRALDARPGRGAHLRRSADSEA